MDETDKHEGAPCAPCAEGVCRARILHSGATQLCTLLTEAHSGPPLERGDYVVIPTRHGDDVGCVQGTVRNAAEYTGEEIVRPKRRATEDDLVRHEDDLAREREAFEVCRSKIREHNLDMKLVSAHFLLQESKILFLFSAEERVDFRELVRELVAVLRIRVELRQIGVRDEARVLGGIGGCSRQFCCSSVTDRLQPVSIKMAKEQNLTLNSMKISGACGRLLCCLAYEFDTYREARRRLPRSGAEIAEGDEVFRVLDVNVLTERLRLGSQSGRVLTVHVSELAQGPDGKWALRHDPQASSEESGRDPR
jgi:cell fate regulator YaaT (PSP1 superfamily)